MVRESVSDTILDLNGCSGCGTTTKTSPASDANLGSQQFSVHNDCKILKNKLLVKSTLNWNEFTDGKSGSQYDCGIPKGCQFSPDGTCLLTARANKLEIYNTPEEIEDGDGVDGNGAIANSGGDGKIATGGWEPVITCNNGGSIRSYIWYPHMKSSDPASCCFLGVSCDSPVKLYDAYDGSVRATYSPYNALDEMESPTTLCFAENGQKLVTGGLKSDRLLHVFDINRPGREHSLPLLKLGKTRRSKDGQKGLVSAMVYSERNGVIAVGAYSPGSIYLYDLRTYSRSAVAEIVMSSSMSTVSGGSICVAGHGKKVRKNKRKRYATTENGDPADIYGTFYSHEPNTNEANTADHPPIPQPSMDFSTAKLQWYQSRTRGGVTQLAFENDDGNGAGGHYLFSTSRRSDAILQWDLRKLSASGFCPGIASFATKNDTNQRIEFEIHGDLLWTGGTDGCVRVHSYRRPNSTTTSSLLAEIPSFLDCVNGISLHPNATLNPDKNRARLENLLTVDLNDGKNPGGDGSSCTNEGFNNPAESLFAVALGRRHFPSEDDFEDDIPYESLMNRMNRLAGSTQIHSF